MKKPDTYVIDTAARLYDELMIAEHHVTRAVYRLRSAETMNSSHAGIKSLERQLGRLREAVERAVTGLLAYAEGEELLKWAKHDGVTSEDVTGCSNEEAVGIIADVLKEKGHRFNSLKLALADLSEAVDVGLDQIAYMGERVTSAIEWS
ncbi:MAG: hypothetical protein ACQEVT_16740 [Pseudomonadota bacterium]